MNTYERVKNIVAIALNKPADQITPETSLRGDLAADSLEQVEIVIELEKAFCIDLGDDTFTLETVKELVDYIEARLGENR